MAFLTYQIELSQEHIEVILEEINDMGICFNENHEPITLDTFMSNPDLQNAILGKIFDPNLLFEEDEYYQLPSTENP